MFKDLATCSDVFVLGNTRQVLKRPYKGSYEVIKRISEVNFLLEIGGTRKVVNVERLKPAYYVNSDVVDAIRGLREGDSTHSGALVTHQTGDTPRDAAFDPPVEIDLPLLPRLPTSYIAPTIGTDGTRKPAHRTSERTYAHRALRTSTTIVYDNFYYFVLCNAFSLSFILHFANQCLRY